MTKWQDTHRKLKITKIQADLLYIEQYYVSELNKKHWDGNGIPKNLDIWGIEKDQWYTGIVTLLRNDVESHVSFRTPFQKIVIAKFADFWKIEQRANEFETPTFFYLELNQIDELLDAVLSLRPIHEV